MKVKNEQQTLTLVLEKVQQEQKNIGNKVRGMKAFIESEQQQERSLQVYQQEYLEKIRNQSHTRVSEIQRYRSFCQQLEQALSQQRQKIQLAKDKLAQLQADLVKRQHSMTILQELIKKKGRMIALHEEKQLQKVCDDLSLRPRLSNSRI